MKKSANKSMMTRWMWLFLTIFLVFPVSSKAAANFSSSELDTLVSTIALYPDPLLVHVLAASTYGEQIPGANAWAQEHKHLQGEELAKAMEEADLSYDPSVQALIPFPTVLSTMAKYQTWSDQLGDAVATQKDQVMDAIQRLRSAAYSHGQLKSDEQVRVEKGSTIIIEPVRTEYVYVPVYNPRVVFYVYADAAPAIRYHHHAWLGSWYGEWGWGSCWFEWDSHFIYVRDYRWYHHRPIPRHPRRYNPPPRRLETVRPDKRPLESTYRKLQSVERKPAAPVSSKPSYAVPPTGGVSKKRASSYGPETNLKSSEPAKAPAVPAASPFNASSGNSTKKRSEESSDYTEEYKSTTYGRTETRKAAPSAPSGGVGGFGKSKRRK